MVKGRRSSASMPLMALAGTCTAIGVLAATAFRPEVIIDRGVEAALAHFNETTEQRVIETAEQRREQPARRQALADSPAFWLSSLEDGDSTELSQPLQVGDRIDITGRSGRKTLEVVDIHQISPDLTRVEHASGPRYLLVTFREVGPAKPRLMRIIIESDEPVSVGIGEAPRTL